MKIEPKHKWQRSEPGEPDTRPESENWEGVEEPLKEDIPFYEPGDKDAESELKEDAFRWD